MQTIAGTTRHPALHVLRLALVMVMALVLLSIPRAARAAATVTVTNTNPTGTGSLAQAINDVDAGGTINFDLTGCPCTITPVSALAINKNLTINGPGASLLTVSGGNTHTVIYVNPESVTATISGISVKYGGGVTNGGGIINDGTLTLSQAVIANNSASVSGAGLFSSSSGTATLTDVIIRDNIAGSGGGGIFNSHALTLQNVTITGNTATNSYGGGLNNNGPATAKLTNVTISDNTAKDWGGGISNGDTVVIVNSTITNNKLTSASTMGGIANFGTVTFQNTIVAHNPPGNCGGPAWSTFTTNGYNLENGTSCHFTTPTVDLNVADAKLGALGNNGGFTPTHALLSGSPAIDQIPQGTNGCGDTMTTDQRGGARPMSANCDIGAFESGQVPVLTSIDPTSGIALGPTFTLTLNGSNFISGAHAQWGSPPGAPLTTSFVSSTQLTATVSSGYLNTGGNYAISVVNPAVGDGTSGVQTFAVNKLSQAVTFGALANKKIGDPSFALSATASSGLAVTYTASGSCSVTGNLVTLTAAGTCTITAHQTGNGVYNAAADVPQSFTIAQAFLYLPLAIR